MKGYFRNGNAFLPDFFQQLWRKMQPGRGGRCRTVIFCIYRLIPVLVLKLMGNIGRQRHLSQPIQNRFKNSLISKLNQPVALFCNFQHFSRQNPAAKKNFSARPCLFSRFYQSFPNIILSSFQQQDFHFSFCAFPLSKEPRWDYPGIIEHQAVPRFQIIQNTAKLPVLQLPRLFVKHDKTGTGTVLQRVLGN